MSKQSRKAGPIRLRRVALAQMKAAMRSNVIVQPHEMHNLEWIEANSATFSKYATDREWLNDLKQWYLPLDSVSNGLRWTIRLKTPAPMAILYYKDV